MQNLLVAQIHPSIWKKLGNSETDVKRRAAEMELIKHATEFASRCGMLAIVEKELNLKADYSLNAEEWLAMQKATALPSYVSLNEQAEMSNAYFLAECHNVRFKFCHEPVQSERHIGIDQGTKNFAIAVVDKCINEKPNSFAADVYDLNLPPQFNATDVVLALRDKTNLLTWMQLPCGNELPSSIDRVIVHIEQMSIHNKNSKLFGINLGRSLQRFAAYQHACMVKLSQPHVLRANGPVFKMGDKIVETLKLQSVFFRPRQCGSMISLPQKRRIEDDHLSENDSDDDKSSNYRYRKCLSASKFKYIIEVDEEKLNDMQLNLDRQVEEQWRQRQAERNGKVKLDDVADVLLHSLNDILCSSYNFRQLTPSVPSLYSNRTVAISLFPDYVHWVVILCSWNAFLVENIGVYDAGLHNDGKQKCFKSAGTVDLIVTNISQELRVALTALDGGGKYNAVDNIRIIVKQQIVNPR